MKRLVLATVALSLLAAPAGAQMHFPTPGDRAQYERYLIPEQCLAAARRVVDSVQWGTRPDTMPFDARDTLPSAAAATARRCGERFQVAVVERQSLSTLRDLALMAGEDSVARAVTERQIADARGKPLAERAAAPEKGCVERADLGSDGTVEAADAGNRVERHYLTLVR